LSEQGFGSNPCCCERTTGLQECPSLHGSAEAMNG